MQPRLRDKVLIVAGGGGIGDAIARRYASEGASVVIGDLNGDGAQAAAAEIVASGGTAVGTTLDGADEVSVRAIVDLAVSTYGGLDGFNANFAMFERGGDTDVLGMPIERFDEVMRVNVRGFVLCTQAALPAMLARGGGSIVYTGSGASYIAEHLRVAYAMSKTAIHALMRHVASRYGPQGIRANVLSPGVIFHPKLEASLPADIIDGFKSVTALKTRLGRPEDIAAMSALMMADEGAYITGQVISVDGGNTMRP